MVVSGEYQRKADNASFILNVGVLVRLIIFGLTCYQFFGLGIIGIIVMYIFLVAFFSKCYINYALKEYQDRVHFLIAGMVGFIFLSLVGAIMVFALPSKEKIKEDSKEEIDMANYRSIAQTKYLTTEEVEKWCIDIYKFCYDFNFEPDIRLLNTLKYCESPSKYILNTMELIGSSRENMRLAKEKFESLEWQELLKKLKQIKPLRDPINKRLVIYYGDIATGKTTAAIQYVTNKREPVVRIVASASSDPDDLFTRFQPNHRGGVDIILTEIGEAMMQGRPIIIDEVNLFSPTVLERLQGVTDSTEFIIDRKMKISIRPGFEIIGTMNNETNLGTYILPSPLLSRAKEIKKFGTIDFKNIF